MRDESIDAAIFRLRAGDGAVFWFEIVSFVDNCIFDHGFDAIDE